MINAELANPVGGFLQISINPQQSVMHMLRQKNPLGGRRKNGPEAGRRHRVDQAGSHLDPRAPSNKRGPT